MAAAVLICVLMPKGYGVLAGYQIQTLREEQEKLMADQAVLELREASLMSPERMQVLAKQLAAPALPSEAALPLQVSVVEPQLAELALRPARVSLEWVWKLLWQAWLPRASRRMI